MLRVARKIKLIPVLGVFCALLLLPASIPAFGDEYGSAFRRVDRALQAGQLTLKDAVRLQAQLLYAPQEIPADSAFYPREGPVPAPKQFYRELFEDVKRVWSQLSEAEKNYLASLSPDLQQFISRQEAEALAPAAPVPPQPPSAYDRVAQAADLKQISRKEAVLLQARLLFAPPTIPPTFQRQAGEEAVSEPCLTGFYTDVSKVFPQLTPAEKDFLRGLDPELATLIEAREAQKAGLPAPQALPDFPFLNKRLPGPNCIVHYTTDPASPHRIFAADYPTAVRDNIESAIQDMVVT